MTEDGDYMAVVDRFEGNQAVLELSAEDVRDEMVVQTESLPEGGRHVDAVFKVSVDDGELSAITYDKAESEERLDDAQDRFDSLSERL